jgi:phosphomannomutase / phosphoglucomutase
MNSAEFAMETLPVVRASGFREYDARWIYGKDINLVGVRHLGLSIGTLLQRSGKAPSISVGHDYRSYSGAIKQALMIGLMASGCAVYDIGLALTPMAYFAQFELDTTAVAMVTASHNENGWAGIKVGFERPLTFGPDEMAVLRDMTLSRAFEARQGGAFIEANEIFAAYLADLAREEPLTNRRIKAIVACGNGTAGLFAPKALRAIGCEVIELDCDLDFNFPRYNPNPEDIRMLAAMGEAVRSHGADIALGFDGDGDRCGVVGDDGHEIFADKIGLMLARDIAKLNPGCKFLVDVKSTGLFETDPVLSAANCITEYYRTGHSHMKRRLKETGAAAGFEKSGHYFFSSPYGRGYDDGLVSAIQICRLLDRAKTKSISQIYRELPATWSSPTMSPYCADEAKYGVVSKITDEISSKMTSGSQIANQTIVDINTVNGARFRLRDGSWGLVRASSNKPELVVVCESTSSADGMTLIFREIEAILARHAEVGMFNQKI